jgi:hypothetical protein
LEGIQGNWGRSIIANIGIDDCGVYSSGSGCKKGDREMRRKNKTVWCYLDGKKHCDVVMWALAANVSVVQAKELLTAQYPDMKVTFKVQ